MPLLNGSIAKYRASEAASNKGGEFIGFVGGAYRGKKTPCILRCQKHGIWDTTIYHNLVSVGRWCKYCSKTLPLGREISEEIIVDLCEKRGYSFLGFPEGYSNSQSKLLLKCGNPEHRYWQTALNDLRRGKGCPSCAKTGFDSSLPGWLYALTTFDGQYVKIGISNHPNDRLKRLRTKTPFRFRVMYCYRFKNGSQAAILEKEFHSLFLSAGFRGFDGATEWLYYSEKLMQKLEEIT